MLKLSIYCTTFETNYNSCTVSNSENIGSSSEGAQDKGKTGWNSIYHQNWWFSEFRFIPPLNANVLFCRFYFNLILCMTKLRVPVLCFFLLKKNTHTLTLYPLERAFCLSLHMASFFFFFFFFYFFHVIPDGYQPTLRKKKRKKILLVLLIG